MNIKNRIKRAIHNINGNLDPLGLKEALFESVMDEISPEIQHYNELNSAINNASELYTKMRNAQKGYFKTKDTFLLKEAKKLEQECDQAIKRIKNILNKPCEQQSLFT